MSIDWSEVTQHPPIAPHPTLLDPNSVYPCGSIDPKITEFVIEPATGAHVETDATFPFFAYVIKSDDSRSVVTTSSTWWVNDTESASIGEHTGIARSLLEPPISGGFTERDVIVYARYTDSDGKTWQASAELTCESECVGTALDIVLCLDRSGSMSDQSGSGMSKRAVISKAAKILIDNMREDRDKVGIVTFAGNIYVSPTVWFYEKEATLDQILTTDQDTLNASLTTYFMIRGDCGGRYPNPTQCCTGIGGGLEEAVAELNSSRHRDGAQKVIILMTDGMENINSPTPESVATDAKDNHDIMIVTIGVDVPSAFKATLNSLATPGKGYLVDQAEDALGIFSSIPHIICYENDQYYGYLYTEPEDTVWTGEYDFPADYGYWPVNYPMSEEQVSWMEEQLMASVNSYIASLTGGLVLRSMDSITMETNTNVTQQSLNNAHYDWTSEQGTAEGNDMFTGVGKYVHTVLHIGVPT